MEKKYTPFLVVGVIVALLFAVLVCARLNRDVGSSVEEYHEVSPSADLVGNIDFTSHAHYLFSREGCPHCAKVEEFMNTMPGIGEQLDLVVLKTDTNSSALRQQISDALVAHASECGIDQNKIGVPFLYLNDESLTGAQHCLVGDEVIIDYLATALPAPAPEVAE